MKKTLLCKIILIVFFVLFAASTTVYTVLDAFVLDKQVFDPENSVTANPTFTLAPSKPNKPKETTSSASTTEAPQTNTTANTTLTNPTTTPVTPDDTTPRDTVGVTTAKTPTTSVQPTETETPVTTTEAPPAVQYPIIDDLYYKDENIEITIEEKYFYTTYRGNEVETKYFVIDLKLSDIEYLRTHFREEANGTVVSATTSELASDVNAIFAINGDYFSFRDAGFVVRNYRPLRDKARSLKNSKHNGDDALFILPDGSFIMMDENNSLFANGLPSGVYQCFSFGPRLIENGEIMVNQNSEVGQSSSSNPRTAIGIVEPLHYKIVVSEGRLVNNDGMTLLDIATIMSDLGCTSAYNLDGGSSTTLYFNGEVLNTPGRSDGSERSISDIIYINGKKHSED